MPRKPSIKPPILEEGARTFALVWRLARDFMRPHAARIALAFLLMGAAAGSTAMRAWLMQPVLDRIFVGRDSSLLLLIAGAALAIAIVKGLADYGQAVLMNRVGLRVIADVQIALFARLMGADLAYFHGHPSGTLISRFTSDAVLLRSAAANVLGGIGKDALTVVFLVGVMFYQDWLLALISFFIFPLAIHPIVGIGRRMRRVSANTQAEIGQLTTLLSQTFQGARLVKAYGMEAYEQRRAAGLFERLFALTNRATRTRSRASPMMETLGGAAIAIVILYGGHQVIAESRTPGAFFSFITALLLAYQPLKSLANLNASLQEGLAAAQRIFQVLDVEPTIRRPAGRPAAAHRRRRNLLRAGALRLCPGRCRPRRRLVHSPGRANGGAGRRVGGRQVDDPQPDPALFRCRGRQHRGRRTGYPHREPGLVARCGGARRPGGHAVRRHPAGQHRLWPVRRRGSRHRGGGAGGRSRRVHPRAAERLRHAGRRAWRAPLRRPAPAAGDRPGDAEGRAHSAARRGDLGARQRIRAPGPDRLAHA